MGRNVCNQVRANIAPLRYVRNRKFDVGVRDKSVFDEELRTVQRSVTVTVVPIHVVEPELEMDYIRHIIVQHILYQALVNSQDATSVGKVGIVREKSLVHINGVLSVD